MSDEALPPRDFKEVFPNQSVEEISGLLSQYKFIVRDYTRPGIWWKAPSEAAQQALAELRSR